ncbi:hypothetical protein WOC76_04290 [Methylocystis sp. IM3]|uniref:hypothetical protein n=1 Tax=unclassified Methylocystis TaxID=2625913 RepID=UPI0030F8F0A1
MSGWSQADYFAAMLAALGVIITVLAVFIGIAAIWGYSQISKEAAKAAARAAKKIAQKEARSYLQEHGPRLVAEELDRRYGKDQGYGAGAAKDDGNAG